MLLCYFLVCFSFGCCVGFCWVLVHGCFARGGRQCYSTMIGGFVVVVVAAINVNIQRNFDLFFIVLATETNRINLYTISF